MERRLGRGLIFKIGTILLILLMIKLLMISVGIYSAGHLKGDAKAINFAGSERMRSFKLSFLLTQWLKVDGERQVVLRNEIEREVARFEEILKYLREGEYPKGENQYNEPALIGKLMGWMPSTEYLVSIPGFYEPMLKSQIEKVDSDWYRSIKPMIARVVDVRTRENASWNLQLLNEELPLFVNNVDRFVSYLEDSFDRKVRVFTALQYVFLLITILITLVALDHIFLHTKKSVDALMEGIRAITSGTFFKRVAVVTNDEMGELASGFNYMADKLEESYWNLEKKVEEKTSALEERNKELSILYEMVASLKKSLPIDDILTTFLKKMAESFNISGGAIRLCEEDGSLRLAATVGLSDVFKANIYSGECLCGVISRQEASNSWNTTLKTDDITLKECRECDFNAAIEIPITYKDRKLGIITLFQSEAEPFTEQESRLIESLNNHLAAAIEYYELNTKTRKLAIMEERNMLANELHDSIAQSLAYLKIQGKLLEESLASDDKDQARTDLDQIRKGIEESNRVVRELLLHFRTKIESESLEATIRKFLSRFRAETGVKTALDADESLPVLSPDAEVHVLHIVQEALANARKYAAATSVKVSIKSNGNFGVIIEDNGCGFDMAEVKSRDDASHVGIDIMRERAVRLGADLSIESSSDGGTSVRLTMT